MKYCNKCGKQLEADVKFCTECGEPVINAVQEPVAYTQAQTAPTGNVLPSGETPEERKAGNTLGIISLCLYFGGPLVTFLLSFIVGFTEGVSRTSSTVTSSLTTLIGSISGIAGLAAYVLMIVGRVKYPKNTLCKVVMWIYIGFLILGVLSFILFFVFCYITCATMDTSGCN